MKKRKLKNEIILNTKEFYLIKLFGIYWHHSRKADKLIFYLEFLINEIDQKKGATNMAPPSNDQETTPNHSRSTQK